MDKDIVKRLIEKFDKQQLQELVFYIVSENVSAGEALIDYCHKKDSKTKTENHTFIIEKKVWQHWNKASEIIEEFDMYGGGLESDEEEACYELDAMVKMFEENDELSWLVRKEILDQMLRFVASDNSGFTDYLMDIAHMMCTNKHENIYLADFLIEHGNSYYRGIAARLYLQNGEEEKFVESKKANLEYGSDYLELASYYNKCNDDKTALKIVVQGLEKAEGRLDGIYEYLFRYYEKNKDEVALENLYAKAEKKNRDRDTITRLMYQHYCEKGDYEKKKETFLKLLSCCDTMQLYEMYQKSRTELTADDFGKEEPRILKIIKNRNLQVYFDILIDKNETKEVIEYITKHQQYRGWGVDQGHYFSKRLADEYPREIVEMYWKEIGFYVGLGKEKNYTHAVKILKEVRNIMQKNKWTEEWIDKYNAFLEEHRRKKLLLRELEGFKV